MDYAIKERRLWEFADRCRTKTISYREPGEITCVAFATLLKQGWVPDGGPVDDDLEMYVRHEFPVGSPQEEALPVGAFSNEELAGIVMWRDWNFGRSSGETSTPSTFSRIAARILDLEEHDRIADVCCGHGSFMSTVAETHGVRRFYGIDYNFSAAMVSKMRASVLGIEATIEVGDLTSTQGSFDKIFVDAPIRPRILPEDRKRLTIAASEVLGDDTPFAGEWLHSTIALSHLAEGGRMVAVMAGHALYDGSDRNARRSLVTRGLVECVILLPERLHPATSIPLNLVVFSHGNERVRFVDASDIGTRGRRNTELSDGDIAEIVRRATGGSDAGTAVAGSSELSSERWRLDPKRYASRTEVDGVPLGSLAEVKRGASISARDLDERVTDEHTPWRYLMIKDVGEHGEVAASLTFLKDLRRGEERYLLQDRDIVVGRMPPFKSALVRVPEGESVLCSGNLFVLRPDTDEVDPTYLRLFLSSDVGGAQLRDACVGSSVRSVPIQALKEAKVPMVPMERQREIASEYERLRAEMDVYERKLRSISNSIERLFPEKGEE